MRWLLLALACLAGAVGLFRLVTSSTGLEITTHETHGTPITVFRRGEEPAPVVVVAHGFAGSQQLMQPFAITLARSGYVAVTYDLLGHGRNPAALTGDVTKVEGATASLITELDSVVRFARSLPGSDGRLALLGHSMATDVLVRYATAHPDDVEATVAVSMFSPAVTGRTPRNLLMIVGALEAGLRSEAIRVLALSAGAQAREGETYGSAADGTARRVAVADYVEHVGVLYIGDSLTEARNWLNEVFDRTERGQIDRRGLSLLLFFAGALVAGGLASRLLPRAVDRPAGFGASWRQLLVLGLAPAVLTPLLAWTVPTGFLPLPVGENLAVHFFVYGVLTAAGIFLLGRSSDRSRSPVAVRNVAVATAAVTLSCLLVIYLPVDRFVTSFFPTPSRLLLVAAMLVGMLPYFIADEWLTRGATAVRAAYLFTKICFLLSLALAIALNVEALFFLIVIVPVILVFFTVFGLISSWVYRRTGHPIVGAVTNSILFAWAIAVTFPVLGPAP
jgi:pimeloyl-ACP methyl ester carboxylesterase